MQNSSKLINTLPAGPEQSMLITAGATGGILWPGHCTTNTHLDSSSGPSCQQAPLLGSGLAVGLVT
jgi:hypothetical protein